MNFHGTKKLLPIVSHDLWAQNRKIVIHGIWIPSAWDRVKFPWDLYFKNKTYKLTSSVDSDIN